MVRRALAAAIPVTVAGVLQLTLGVTGASAALPAGTSAAPAGILSAVEGLLHAQPATAPEASGASASATSHGLVLGLLDTCVACTSAHAAPGDGGAGATALRVLGNDLSAGASSGHGSQGGALVTLPSNPLLDLVLAGWTASSDSSATAGSGDARAALTDLALAGGSLATVSLVQSTSHAGAAGSGGSGSSASDGALITLLDGAVDLGLLHSGTDASGRAQISLASVNGIPVGALSSSGAIPVSIPGILDLALLQAQSAAVAGGTGSAAIGSVTNVLGTPGTAAGVLGGSSTGGAHAGSGGTGPATSTAASSPPAAGLGIVPGPRGIPQTGSFLGVAGLTLVIAGTGLAAASTARRRRRATVA